MSSPLVTCKIAKIKNTGKKIVHDLFILFLARADDEIVVSGVSVPDKPEAHKRSFPKATVESFHTKGWTNFCLS